MTDVKMCGAKECSSPMGPKGAKGYCSKHYHRLKRYGDPNREPKFTPTKRPPTCTIDDCPKPTLARGMCGAHWHLWKKNGDPRVKKKTWDTRQKIDPWSRVRKTDTHWYWTGYRDKKGYGWLSGKPAHRIIWELVNGPIPDGMQIDHVCRVHGCVRPTPEHLEPVTQQENIRRGEGISVYHSLKTHCPRKHPYAGGNLYVDPSGGRRCRECGRITAAALKMKRAA